MLIWFWQRIKSLEEIIVAKDAELAAKEKEKLEANNPEETIPDVNTNDDIPDVNSADESGDINLLKSSLQELVDIVSQYEPDFCNTCGKSFSLVELKECAYCHEALYCSIPCRKRNWKKKHKDHCKDIRRLQNTIDTERNKLLKSGGISLKKVMAIPQRYPTFLESGRHYKSISFYRDEQVLFGYHRGPGLKSAFVKVDDKLVNLPLRGERTSMCLMSNNYSSYVVTSQQGLSKSILDFYYYRIFDGPFQGCVVEITCCLGSLSFFEGHLYAVNTVWNIIQEFQVNLPHVKSTGLIIPMRAQNLELVTSMCQLRQSQERKVIFVYKVKGRLLDFRIKCVNFNGQGMWEIGDESELVVDGVKFVPRDLCKDNKGNVYVTDVENNRIALLNTDNATIRPILETAGKIESIAFRDSTQELYVMHKNIKGRMLITVYDVCK